MAQDAILKIKAAESDARKILEEAEDRARQITADAKSEAEKLAAEIIAEAKRQANDDIKKAENAAEEYKNNYIASNREKNSEPLKLAALKKDEAISGVIELLF